MNASAWTKVLIVLVILVLLPLSMGLAWLLLAHVAIPTWRIFLGFSGFWLPLGVFIVGTAVLAVINIPTGLRVADRMIHLNAMGFFTPIVLIVFVRSEIQPSFQPLVLLPWAASLVLYAVFSRVQPKTGVVIPWILITGLGIALVFYLHYVSGLELRELMWWAFTIQYSSILVPDLARALLQAHRLHASFTGISVGGAGARDALWVGPTSCLTYSFIAQWLLWGGHDPSIFVR